MAVDQVWRMPVDRAAQGVACTSKAKAVMPERNGSATVRRETAAGASTVHDDCRAAERRGRVVVVLTTW